MKNETFRKITGTRTYQIPPTNKQPETRYLRNHHKLVLKDGYQYEGTIGGKTGYTSKAKYTLVTVAKRDDLELISVVMRVDTSAHQYEDTMKLLILDLIISQFIRLKNWKALMFLRNLRSLPAIILC